MTFWTKDAAKVKYAKEYFSSLNSMASRIIEAENKTVQLFSKGNWEELSVSEKENVLDNSIILPGVAKRYKSIKSKKLPIYYQNVFPKLIVTTGQKIASHSDDDVQQGFWKDEHSDPFSWETKSQMNMPLPSPTVKPLTKTTKENIPSEDIIAQVAKMSVGKVELNFENLKDYSGPKEPSLNSFQSENNKRNADALGSCHYDVGQVESPDAQSLLKIKPTLLNGSSTEREDSNYELPPKEVKRRLESKKSKSSLRINPRSSLTLDGAIRNLETAMREEQQEKTCEVKPPKDDKLLNNVNDNYKSDDNPSTTENLLGDGFERFLLGDKSSLAMNSKPEPEQDGSFQKSGFDFLDNW